MNLVHAEWVMTQLPLATNRIGQSHRIQGLYVADNSVLPTLTAAGPVLSNVALAIRLADHIARESG